MRCCSADSARISAADLNCGCGAGGVSGTAPGGGVSGFSAETGAIGSSGCSGSVTGWGATGFGVVTIAGAAD